MLLPLPAPPFNRNQEGFAVGGPILKNRLFASETTRHCARTLPVSPHYLTVPTALMRTGNFTELENVALSNGNGIQTQYPRCYPGTDASGNPLAGETTFGASGIYI
jgi:hypothetical protein